METNRNIKLTDLLPTGDDRYKVRNGLLTNYYHKTGRKTDFGTRMRAEILNDYHFLLDTGIIVAGTIAGLATIGLAGIGAYKVYQTIDVLIDKLF